jgi:hypothetical protein
MRFHMEFEQHEIDAISDLVKKYPALWRYEENVVKRIPELDDHALWMAHMRCLLTTQQRSGAGSPINVFLDREPFLLTLTACRESNALEELTFRLLTDAVGIRRTNRIAKAVAQNLLKLEQGEWDTLRSWCDKLLVQRKAQPDPSHRALEEEAANYMNTFHEFGPKQARNFWQMLGLTRYVFVLDSRIIGWLRQYMTFEPGLLTANGLGDPDYYRFISDILFDLCNQAGVLPCMFDGAVFESVEAKRRSD